MTNRTEQFDLYLRTKELGLIHAARVGLLEQQGILSRMQLRYQPEYLAQPEAFALDPVQLPLGPQDITLLCSAGGLPGVLDDFLPDNWGRNVLARLAFYNQQKHIRTQSPLDILAMLGNNRIGALQWVNKGGTPAYEQGADITAIAQAELVAQTIDSNDWHSTSVDDFSLAYLANAGSGVGGARPKALVSENGSAYLAKFNSLSKDTYNNAHVELACLNMAREAGLNVRHGKVITGINGREVLLLERFDIEGEYRRHLITVNTMLKDSHTQCDRGGAFNYEDVADLIKRFSADPQTDLVQLLRIMLFNAAIHNTDDHERNFSFWQTDKGLGLSPAYDMVPTMATGQYHIAGYNYSPFPPKPTQITGQVFGLPAPLVKNIAQQITTVINQWPAFAETAGVSLDDQQRLAPFIRA